MADNHPHVRGKMDIRAQTETFDLFWSLTKWGTIFVVLTLILMAIFLV